MSGLGKSGHICTYTLLKGILNDIFYSNTILNTLRSIHEHFLDATIFQYIQIVIIFTSINLWAHGYPSDFFINVWK